MELLIAVIAGLLLGAVGGLLWGSLRAGRRNESLQEELITLRTQAEHLRNSLQEAETRQRDLQGELRERENLLSETRTRLTQSETGQQADRRALDEKVQELRQERERHATAMYDLAEVRNRLTQVETERVNEKQMLEEKVEELKALREKFEGTFKALSSDALKNNREEFMALAKNAFEQLMSSNKGDLEKRQMAIKSLVDPMSTSLKQFDEKVQHLERARANAYAELQEQVKTLQGTNEMLRTETQSLVQALRTPQIRGQWGEMHLKRAIEAAGMSERVDFDLQVSTRGEDENLLRPDMIIRLPNGRVIVVDCKTPAEAYLQALQTEDAHERNDQLRRHANHVRKHIDQLSAKAYWRQIKDESPEFVVMFLPNEAFFSAAVQQDPTLIDYGSSRNVMIATPTTLIALLKTVAYGWHEQRLAEEAKETSALARELYERVVVMANHFEKLGRSLGSSVDHYNRAISSMEKRVFPTGRKLEHLSADKALPELSQIDKLTSTPSLPEGS
ncbi:MAG: hypothetical protein E1N59_2654 [Puniceicoccaceae bacterium 5H]|nr:MAG: hypothetical protein E1N59_2654 [Puniceicoccaceae bacterium 5H]